MRSLGKCNNIIDEHEACRFNHGSTIEEGEEEEVAMMVEVEVDMGERGATGTKRVVGNC